MNMKKLLVIFGILIFSAGCEKDQINRSFINDQSIGNINGTWIVVSYEDFEKNSVTKKNDVDSWNGMDVILTFTIDSIYGRNTTNSVFGNYTVSGRGIHIIRFGGTKIGQPEWGNMFSDVVHNLESFKINERPIKILLQRRKEQCNS